jgi:starch synthase (maltosyl-transferring)
VSDGAAIIGESSAPPASFVAGAAQAPLRLYQLGKTTPSDAAHLDAVAAMGFDTVLVVGAITRDDAALGALVGECRARGLQVLVDLDLDPVAAPAWSGPIDPRQFPADGDAGGGPVDAFDRVGAWIESGVSGVRLPLRQARTNSYWQALIDTARAKADAFLVLGDVAGASRPAVKALGAGAFDWLTSSLPWWDGRARWLVEEYEDLRPIAPLIAPLDHPSAPLRERHPADGDLRGAYLGRLALCAALGDGFLAPAGFEYGVAGAADAPAFDISSEIRAANAIVSELEGFRGELRLLTSEGAPITALLKSDRGDPRQSERGLLLLLNPDLGASAQLTPDAYMAAAGADFGPFERLDGGRQRFEALAPGEVRLLMARRAQSIGLTPAPSSPAATAAAEAPRIVIEGLSPVVDGGAFVVKRTVGERLEVEADVFADGHTTLGVELKARAVDRETWRCVPMRALANDRWAASIELERLGRWEFFVEAWIDTFGAYVDGLAKKLGAGVAEAVDLEEGRRLIATAAADATDDLGRALSALSETLSAAPDDLAGERLTAPETRALMRQADPRAWRQRSPVQPLDAERLSARFSSWYELFPRSQSDSPERHGRFDDVIARLPDIAAMQFDVLYMPPIHPIGRKGRKGRDNSLTARSGDPGSPYAIGADEGGHTAIHPELGTLDDFRRLVAAAHAHGLELALDFAIQCSPDHPWLREHPGWFDWRPDGSLKYAENPPKKYEDIVNVDFYAKDAVPDLWLALRDAVLFWVGEGVRIFRVDNPHTKPLPFWEWMIGDVRSAHPDVIFLAEAFTRPKLMYRLAKLGFSQSYTYFTWRHSKSEFIDYMTELATQAPKDFFRPHFFVNTPDINPYFLQSSGRAGFLIRAALAATLSGLWGVYSGFELLEADATPGKEEYRDSEKYEIKPRDWNAPGNIKADITRLNRIRKGQPALQTHLNVRFHSAFNDQVLYFAKPSPAGEDMILVAISLDPHAPQYADIEVPLWEWGLPDDGAVDVLDLVEERRFVWRGKIQHVGLTPEQPYAIWRVQPMGLA